MRTVWKYELPIRGLTDLPMPRGSQILSIQRQHSDTCLSLRALVDTTEPLGTRTILVNGTGQNLVQGQSAERWLATVQCHEGALVWHVFDAGWMPSLEMRS